MFSELSYLGGSWPIKNGKTYFPQILIRGTPNMKIMEMKKQLCNNNITINAASEPGDPCITVVLNRLIGYLLSVDHVVNR